MTQSLAKKATGSIERIVFICKNRNLPICHFLTPLAIKGLNDFTTNERSNGLTRENYYCSILAKKGSLSPVICSYLPILPWALS